MVSLLLCVSLVVLVLDLIVAGVIFGSDLFVRRGGAHLSVWILLVTLFRDDFSMLAEKIQKRVVFDTRVYGFFSLSCGALLAAFFYGDHLPSFVAWTLMISVLWFWLGAQLGNFYPIWTRRTGTLVQISFLLIGGSFIYLLGASVGGVRSLGTLVVGPGVASVGSYLRSSVDQLMTSSAQNVADELPTDEQSNNNNLPVPEPDQSGSVGIGEDEPSEGVNNNLSDDEEPRFGSEQLTYRVFLPYLMEQGLLFPSSDQISFTYIGRENSLYEPFQRAWSMKMIGTNINPDRLVRCANFMVVRGIAQGREIDSSLPVLDAFRQKAVEDEKTGTCAEPNQLAEANMLNLIPPHL